MGKRGLKKLLLRCRWFGYTFLNVEYPESSNIKKFKEVQKYE